MSLSDRLFGNPRERFANAVLSALRERGRTAAYIRDDFRIDVAVPGKTDPIRIYLANTFAECKDASDAEKAERIRRLISISDAPDTPQTWEEVRPMLRPVLHSGAFGAGIADPLKAPLSRPAFPLLSELVVVDRPDTMAFVGAHQLAEWGVSAETVFAAARENLASGAFRLAEREPSDRPTMSRFVETGDAYFCSMPLLPGWLAAMRGAAGGRPIAFVTEQSGLLLVGGTEGAEGTEGEGTDGPGGTLTPLLDLAFEEYTEAVRPLSPMAYTVDEAGTVVEYTVPRDHPDFAAVRRAQSTLIAAVYSRQTEALRAEYQEGGVDVYVASVIHAASPNGGVPFTAAAWTDGIQSSLPRTHYVAINDPVALVPFDAVTEILDLHPVEGVYPPRYRVGGWPSGETMARLLARAEEP